MASPRVVYSIRLHPATINDIKKLSQILGDTQSGAIRFLINRGFNSIGNWRNSQTLIINGKRTLVDKRI